MISILYLNVNQNLFYYMLKNLTEQKKTSKMCTIKGLS